MQFSGILVITSPADIAGVSERLNAMPGVEVYARHVASGRIVVVQEAADIGLHEERLRAIQALPGVRLAELVYHLADAAPEGGEADQTAIQPGVPAGAPPR